MKGPLKGRPSILQLQKGLGGERNFVLSPLPHIISFPLLPPTSRCRRRRPPRRRRTRRRRFPKTSPAGREEEEMALAKEPPRLSVNREVWKLSQALPECQRGE